MIRVPSPSLQPAEVLGDDRGDDRQRRRLPQPGEDERQRAGQADDRGRRSSRRPRSCPSARGGSGRPARSPRSVLMKTGKNDDDARPPAGAARCWSVENIVLRIGASAMIGIALTAAASGTSSSSTTWTAARHQRGEDAEHGAGRAARPARWRRSPGRGPDVPTSCSVICAQIADGAGSRYGGMSLSLTSAPSRPGTPMPTSTGVSTRGDLHGPDRPLTPRERALGHRSSAARTAGTAAQRLPHLGHRGEEVRRLPDVLGALARAGRRPTW